jgi:transcriptional regulator with XRE-family HTH domain
MRQRSNSSNQQHHKEEFMDSVIGKNVRRLRLERAWTQETLAQASKVPVRTIQRAEAGKHMQLETLLAFAGAFDVTPEALRTAPPTNPDAEHLEAILEIITSLPPGTPDLEVEAKLREQGCSESEIRRGIDARRAALKFETVHLQNSLGIGAVRAPEP